MANSDYYIGLISGTSVDGIDCALVQFDNDQPNVIATHFKPSDKKLREKILQLCRGKEIDLELYGQTDTEIGRLFASATNELLDKASIAASSIRAIGSHGQTVFHYPRGEFPFTLQLGDPNSIAALTRITTVADFRRRDMAAGGEGAPLAPLLHRNCFYSPEHNRVVLNVGGISNITVLHKNGQCCAFDTGPANVLMDYWIEKHQQKTFDKNGEWASSGKVNQALLELFLDEEYFSRPTPKSTGRELFNSSWLLGKLQQLGEQTAAEDVQATLLALTVNSIVTDIKQLVSPDQVYVCGGGAHNGALMQGLQQSLNNCTVESTAAAGIDPDWVEAIAFAWMAKQTVEGIALDTSAFTGASEAIILGGIYQA
ncbi:MAG: anhydro-N-acetylmuramic acid kinase [SAR86 cluster bacterium]|uniref:Anhydro-N-acetylmuramic acid kinase n=1 Tax=SAR86 cluster bacterium TaxID=2030880 RepID=A0A2A5ABM5_9GAMM|nr:MAG: anhydro-N-acetylmuramic acid kinase [SAR86 cluster bacterium]